MYQLYDLGKVNSKAFNTLVKKRLSKIIDDQSFIEGPYNHHFESDFAKMHGAQFCRLVANGTDALEISLKAFEIGPGDLVGIPGITFFALSQSFCPLFMSFPSCWIDKVYILTY